VICIDTLGQDRELTLEQKIFILEAVTKFKDSWEEFENEKLLADRDTRMRIQTQDKEYLNDNADKMKDEEDKFVDEQVAEVEDLEDEDSKALAQTKFRLEYQANLLLEQEEFKQRYEEMKQFKVFKHDKFMQSLFYFLGYDKEKLVEPGT